MTGWGYADLMDMDAAELERWCREAVSYHNDMHRTEE